jgi:NADPH-dependent 7-cyano-7-deazaguanine reductase QueF-like protein
MEQLNELNELPMWGADIPQMYEDFRKMVAAGGLPGVTIEDVDNAMEIANGIGK